MTQHEVARAIAEDGICIRTEKHPEIRCFDCPATYGWRCTIDSENRNDYIQWFNTWLAEHPEEVKS